MKIFSKHFKPYSIFFCTFKWIKLERNNMKRIFIILIIINLGLNIAYSQSIEKMQWDKDFQIHITLANDSNYMLNIRELHHTDVAEEGTNSFTYLPTRLENEFVHKLKQTKVDTSQTQENIEESNKTLWSALNNTIGGGWVHLVNSLLYSLETGYLDITAPLMKRPESKWKPSPMTESYKRTKKWEGALHLPIS